MVVGVSWLASARVLATVPKTVLGNKSDTELAVAFAAQYAAVGNKSYHTFSVTVASLAASAVLSWVMALGTSAMVSWAMASVTSALESSGKALGM